MLYSIFSHFDVRTKIFHVIVYFTPCAHTHHREVVWTIQKVKVYICLRCALSCIVLYFLFVSTISIRKCHAALKFHNYLDEVLLLCLCKSLSILSDIYILWVTLYSIKVTWRALTIGYTESMVCYVCALGMLIH